MAVKANEAGSKAKATNPNEELFYALLHAETEDQVTKVLEERGMLAGEDDCKPLGDTENNLSAAGNQQRCRRRLGRKDDQWHRRSVDLRVSEARH